MGLPKDALEGAGRISGDVLAGRRPEEADKAGGAEGEERDGRRGHEERDARRRHGPELAARGAAAVSAAASKITAPEEDEELGEVVDGADLRRSKHNRQI